MQQLVPRKTKVVLKDYSYRRDIENRLLMADLSLFEVDVLREILQHSLKLSVENLSEALEADQTEVEQALDKLKATKLFKLQHGILIIDKEMRKYYESQIEKFDENFEPNMDFLQGLLNKVPIHVLPLWYAIPRSSDHIFQSIIEKYLQTPKIYRQYLEELQFDDPIISSIIHDLYQAPDFRLTSSFLIEKYALSRERFEEILLLLEYHLVGCLSYQKIGNQWVETVTPFHEWLEYLRFEVRTQPRPIKNKNEIQTPCPIEFGFIKDLQTVLKACHRKKLPVKDVNRLLDREESYIQHLLARLSQLEWVTCEKSALQLTEKGLIWLGKSTPEQAASLATDSLYTLTSCSKDSPINTTRNLRQIEKCLRRLVGQGWVYLDNFLEGFTTPLGDREPISLKNKGKKWRYVIPVYNEEEKEFIRAIIRERCFELGLVGKGIHQGKECICLTPFGMATLV